MDIERPGHVQVIAVELTVHRMRRIAHPLDLLVICSTLIAELELAFLASNVIASAVSQAVRHPVFLGLT